MKLSHYVKLAGIARNTSQMNTVSSANLFNRLCFLQEYYARVLSFGYSNKICVMLSFGLSRTYFTSSSVFYLFLKQHSHTKYFLLREQMQCPSCL